tara:strand:+ start:134 stop:460 length:327 start_codon:yes stop_codon:yes gene_type:complete
LILHKTGTLRVVVGVGQIHSFLVIIIEEPVSMAGVEVCLVRVIMEVMRPVVEEIQDRESIVAVAVVALVEMVLMHLFQIILGRPRNIRGQHIALGQVGGCGLVMVVQV